jgi:hypothetical protein
MSSNCDALIETFVTSFGAQARTARLGDWCRLSLPIHTTGGHRIELAVNEISATKVLVSDLGKTLSELVSIGVDPFANQKRAERFEALEREFGVTRQESELQMLVDARDLGASLIRFATALKTISDMAYLHRVSTGAVYRINLAIRTMLEREKIPFSEGERAIVRGVLEPQIQLDFLGRAEERPFGLAVIGGAGTKRLAEVWGFRFEDMRKADQVIRRIAVYDDEEQRWSKASVRILEGTADLALPSSRVDTLTTFLKAA